MSWATAAIEQLQQGRPANIWPRGHSMEPLVSDGQACVIDPVTLDAVRLHDIVLCRVRGRDFLHLVKGIKFENGRSFVLIGNNKGGTNGWTQHVFGKLRR